MKKKVWNICFLILIFVLTCVTVFKDASWSEILYWMTHVRERYIVAAILAVPVFVCCESWIIHYMMGKLGKRVRPADCVRYSFIGFFFSCVTPSASGGQPAQVLYMQKDRIPPSLASVVLLIVTIAYKLVLVVIGIVCFLFARGWLVYYLGKYMVLYYLGMTLNVICITAMLFLVFEERVAACIMMWAEGVLVKIHILKKDEARGQRMTEFMRPYHDAAHVMKEQVGMLVPVMLVTLFQRLLMFFITYLVYCAFRMHGTGMVSIVALQAVVSISVDMLPFPGGMGVSENLFLVLFDKVFGNEIILPAMLLCRGCSFYILLLMSGLVTCYAMWHYNRIKEAMVR